MLLENTSLKNFAYRNQVSFDNDAIFQIKFDDFSSNKTFFSVDKFIEYAFLTPEIYIDRFEVYPKTKNYDVKNYRFYCYEL